MRDMFWSHEMCSWCCLMRRWIPALFRTEQRGLKKSSDVLQTVLSPPVSNIYFSWGNPPWTQVPSLHSYPTLSSPSRHPLPILAVPSGYLQPPSCLAYKCAPNLPIFPQTASSWPQTSKSSIPLSKSARGLVRKVCGWKGKFSCVSKYIRELVEGIILINFSLDLGKLLTLTSG